MFRTLAIVIFCIFLLGLSPDEATIEVSIDRKEVKTGEILTYTVKIEGEFSQPKLILPEFKDFQIVSQSQSKNYSFKNDHIKTVVHLIYFLLASEPGIFTIQPAILKDGNKTYEGKSITIRVKGKPLKEKKKVLPFLEKGIEI